MKVIRSSSPLFITLWFIWQVPDGVVLTLDFLQYPIEPIEGSPVRRLFATIFRALGIDPHEEYDLPGLPTFHRVEEDAEPIEEILKT